MARLKALESQTPKHRLMEERLQAAEEQAARAERRATAAEEKAVALSGSSGTDQIDQRLKALEEMVRRPHLME
eukprot:scaffold651227_cov43-Prasinocladus_malaysianus.AAC.1